MAPLILSPHGLRVANKKPMIVWAPHLMFCTQTRMSCERQAWNSAVLPSRLLLAKLLHTSHKSRHTAAPPTSRGKSIFIASLSTKGRGVGQLLLTS